MISKLEDGIKRIKTSDLKKYLKKQDSWVFSGEINSETKKIINFYIKNDNFLLLIDDFSKDFLKGYINSQNLLSGKRVQYLPSGKKIARGGFSLFAKNLKFNFNEKCQWDVCYENTSGLKTYLYSEDKIHIEQEKKAEIVNKFIKNYPNIMQRLEKDIRLKKHTRYLALYTLIKTLIRVGNLEYYLHFKHKGLTTLQKKDISIEKNTVIFDFIGKDGVPQHITKEFSNDYIKILDKLLKSKSDDDFVFTNNKGVPLHSAVFSKILFDYTKEHFYPHIIRSFYADTKCFEFIKNRKKASKKEVENVFFQIASNLGHKKFNKKRNEWVISYKVTIENYIRPRYVQEMRKIYKKT